MRTPTTAPTTRILIIAVLQLLLLTLSIVTTSVTAFNPSFQGKKPPPPKPAASSPPTTTTEGSSSTTPTSPATAASPEGVATLTSTTTTTPPTTGISISSPPKSGLLQADYGTLVELPDTYASCGQCGASFALTDETFGAAKGGRRMECSVCSHTWFQSRERLGKLGEGYEMVMLPDKDLERIKLNIEEGRNPKHVGDYKMYVGNISFKCTEDDLEELFGEYGPVGDVSMVRDSDGRLRGFGFITMRNKADGEKCLEELDGADLKGRNLNVRPSKN